MKVRPYPETDRETIYAKMINYGDGIQIVVCNADGSSRECAYILRVDEHGVFFPGGVSRDFGFRLDIIDGYFK